jgi:hypothetical protein
MYLRGVNATQIFENNTSKQIFGCNFIPKAIAFA